MLNTDTEKTYTINYIDTSFNNEPSSIRIVARAESDAINFLQKMTDMSSDIRDVIESEIVDKDAVYRVLYKL